MRFELNGRERLQEEKRGQIFNCKFKYSIEKYNRIAPFITS